MVEIMKERRAYIVLVLICVFLCGGVLTISLRAENSGDKRTCEVLVVEKEFPPPKPADPKSDPAAERSWQLHVHRLKLYNELGC